MVTSIAPNESVDANGYPTDEFIAWLKSEKDARLAVEAAADYFNECGYGKATIKEGDLYLATGGWSGCEDVINALHENFYAMQRWESHHRGGLWVFDGEGVNL